MTDTIFEHPRQLTGLCVKVTCFGYSLGRILLGMLGAIVESCGLILAPTGALQMRTPNHACLFCARD